VLLAAGIKVSTDGRGRWMDNVFVERLWRPLKYEYIYLKGYADGPEAKVGIASWVQTAGGRTRRWEIRRRWQSGAQGALGLGEVGITITPCAGCNSLRNLSLLPRGAISNEV
jgi:hypothetical protein